MNAFTELVTFQLKNSWADFNEMGIMQLEVNPNY
jgi:hypothetical protein